MLDDVDGRDALRGRDPCTHNGPVDSESRQSQIVEYARTRGRVEVVPLASELGVATETIRRDLRVLAERRLVKRVHGGAIPFESAAFESGVEYRSKVDLAQKRRIASAASDAPPRRRDGLPRRGLHAEAGRASGSPTGT